MADKSIDEALEKKVAELAEQHRVIRRLEKELLETGSRYERMLKAVTHYVFTVKVDNGVPMETIHNPHCRTITGYDLADFGADPYLWIKMVPKEDRPRVRDMVNTILAGTTPSPIEHRIIKKNGKVIWVSNTSSLSHDSAGRLISYDGLISDITERKEAEVALRKSEDRFRLLYEMTPLGYQSLDEKGLFVEVNRTWLETMGYDRQEVIGRSFKEFLPPQWLTCFEKSFAEFGTGTDLIEKELEMIKKDGSVILVSFHGKVGRNPDGSFRQTHCLLHDITEQKALEREREKLVAELQQALEEIETLRGILPICSHCKKIRDEQGVWNQLEAYIRKHSQAQFSHGVCPECQATYYSEISDLLPE